MLRPTLANRFSAAVVGIVGLATVTSLMALFGLLHMNGLLELAVEENLPSVRAAEELEIALLEQRGFVAYYLLDGGNQHWLDALARHEPSFGEWLDKAWQTAHTVREREILGTVERVFEQYEKKRDEVVLSFDEGDRETARRKLLEDMNGLYDDAYRLCEQFITENQQYVDRATMNARREVRSMTWIVGTSVGLTVFLGSVLLWLFFAKVLFPLRRMVAHAQEFVGEPANAANTLPTDELQLVGEYLRTLMSDVTDARSTLELSRRRLRSAEQLATVGKLAASVAHEIRNPLTALKMWLFSIRREVNGDGALDRKFEVVSQEVSRLERVVSNFLEFSKTPELRLREESLQELLESTLELVGVRLTERQIELHCNIPGDLPPVQVDREQMKQVILNILNNAVEVTPCGGRITVEVTRDKDGEKRRMLVVRIRDTGPGLSEEAVQRIFEPFFTTKEGGTGLGLCIAARITARHEGQLVLESTGGQGTVFAIRIPATGVGCA